MLAAIGMAWIHNSIVAYFTEAIIDGAIHFIDIAARQINPTATAQKQRITRN